ncbi:hypothetical protein [Rickettsia endosymbiont of Culicoides newsteadi]|uniref:hypothetical protein n=1 Tax=Rickettsia endosymbiont of Culicoides newsteadi TaxID=1961830 RepID=UPI000B9A9257|nr:hypothetical protein [Rickettsia endosymbiont of Culicoides newsteadi]OZG31281.1 ribonuclease inhibitor [Rickettsia endosymbiont of Culicoides newsteadi]
MPLEQAIIQQIRTNTITTLNLHDKQIGDAGAKELAQVLKGNHSITNLYLWGNQIGDAGVQALAEALKDYNGLHILDTKIEEMR